MIKSIWIYPPLAIARLGSSDIPLECFFWGPNDDRPRGTGKTTIQPGETLNVAEDASLTAYTPREIIFKDGEAFRPVCPFYELHGEWDADGEKQSGPVTPAVLRLFGLGSKDIQWTVQVSNLKAYHLTLDADCRIDAALTMPGDDTQPKDLRGTSPDGAKNPLIPPGSFIPLGKIQLTRPNENFPEFRLRFTPAKGKFYGPPDLPQQWKDVSVPPDQLFINPGSSWVGWKHVANDQWNNASDDIRTAPGDLFAGEPMQSYGVVDDVCDGIISCSINGAEVKTAYARITVAPPDYAPDRRHPITIADALKDYVDRYEVHDPNYIEDPLTTAEVQDLMERIYETMSSINIDVFNNRVATRENPQIAFSLGVPYDSENLKDYYAFPLPPKAQGYSHPLTIRGRQFHRRFVSIEIFRDMLRERPGLLKEWVRAPVSGNPYFTKQMPPVMRDSSGGPLHLTRRQYDLLQLWAETLQKTVQEQP